MNLVHVVAVNRVIVGCIIPCCMRVGSLPKHSDPCYLKSSVTGIPKFVLKNNRRIGRPEKCPRVHSQLILN